MEIITLADESSFVEKLGSSGAYSGETTADVIISAGHRTHLPLIWASRMHKAKSVLIMRPSLPRACYDYLLIPEHDLSKDPGGRVIMTTGSLNKIPEEAVEKEAKGLILIGGESRHTTWDEQAVVDAVEKILTRTPDLAWTVTDSRRTPPGVLGAINKLSLPVTIIPHEETDSDWLPAELLASRDVWVTPDSASMVNEALTARCAVGLLPLPQHDTRVSRGMMKALNKGLMTSFDDWEAGSPLQQNSEPFHEAARCADLLIERGLFGTS